MRAQAANLVSAVRLVLTPLFVWIVCQGAEAAQTWLTPILFAIIAASDIADGRMARTFGTVSESGRRLDHGSDILFVLSAFAAYAWIGVAPWMVPVAVATAFAVYVIDSWRPGAHVHAGRSLANRLGHVGGVLNWVVIGTLVGNETVGLHLLPSAFLGGLFYLVVTYSSLAVALRVLPLSATMEDCFAAARRLPAVLAETCHRRRGS